MIEFKFFCVNRVAILIPSRSGAWSIQMFSTALVGQHILTMATSVIYARASSTSERQSTSRQVDDLTNDVEVVLFSKLSRCGRTVWKVLDTIRTLKDNGINAYFHKEGLSLFSADGKENPYLAVMVSVLGVCAQLERENITYRLNSGRAKYIADGGKLGRKVGSIKSKERKQEEYSKVILSLKAGKSIRDTAAICGVSVSTVQRSQYNS